MDSFYGPPDRNIREFSTKNRDYSQSISGGGTKNYRHQRSTRHPPHEASFSETLEQDDYFFPPSEKRHRSLRNVQGPPPPRQIVTLNSRRPSRRRNLEGPPRRIVEVP